LFFTWTTYAAAVRRPPPNPSATLEWLARPAGGTKPGSPPRRRRTNPRCWLTEAPTRSNPMARSTGRTCCCANFLRTTPVVIGDGGEHSSPSPARPHIEPSEPCPSPGRWLEPRCRPPLLLPGATGLGYTRMAARLAPNMLSALFTRSSRWLGAASPARVLLPDGRSTTATLVPRHSLDPSRW